MCTEEVYGAWTYTVITTTESFVFIFLWFHASDKGHHIQYTTAWVDT